ncbi:MAG: hypothetical protein JXN65_06200 [Clostridia bacterium]|nr:hypothetical protein [Clostridia bacterium]
MNQIQKNIIKASVVIMVLFAAVLVAFLINLSQSDKLINSPYNKRLKELRQSVEIGSIYDTNGILLAGYEEGERTYSSSETARNSVSHLIGDTYGYCPTGAEIQYASILLNSNESFLSTLSRTIRQTEKAGKDIDLTVDYRLNLFAYDLLKDYSGAVVVQDYTTGEILCMVSTPAFDPQSVIENLSYYMQEDAFVNRAIQGQYAPGSLFYLITAGAAYENIDAVSNRQYTCSGSYNIDNEILQCSSAHGNMNLDYAFQNSCSVFFADLGVELGAKKLTSFAEQLRFNKKLSYSDIELYPSSISVSPKEEAAAFAYAAIGQHEDIVSPLHMSMILGAVANDGKMMSPVLIKSIDSKEINHKSGSRVLSDDTDQFLKHLMSLNAEKIESSNISIFGTEGTAISSVDNSLYPNAWYMGYIDDPLHPLVICVITEQSYVDENVSAIIGKSILEHAYLIGY